MLVLLLVLGWGLAIYWFRRANRAEQALDQVKGNDVLASMASRAKQPPFVPPVSARSSPKPFRTDDDARELAELDPRWRDDDRGTEASFTYVDADGEVTDRTIRNWHSAGPYIEGFCLKRRQNRTFRKDRIEDWA